MDEGKYLKDFIEEKGFKVTEIVEWTGIKRPTIYTHFGKPKLGASIKEKYTAAIGIDWGGHVNKNSLNDPAVNYRVAKITPRLEAEPLHLAAGNDDFENEGSKFEELPDGTIRMRIPIIPYKAFAAGYLQGFRDPIYYDDLEYTSIEVFKKHQGFYLAFEVRGDSMTTLEPEYFRQSIFDGVKVVGRFLPRQQWVYKLHTHSWDAWVIVHKEKGILIKQIIAQDVANGVITIHSLNPDKTTYPDEQLYLDDIEQIFNVVKKIDD